MWRLSTSPFPRYSQALVPTALRVWSQGQRAEERASVLDGGFGKTATLVCCISPYWSGLSAGTVSLSINGHPDFGLMSSLLLPQSHTVLVRESHTTLSTPPFTQHTFLLVNLKGLQGRSKLPPAALPSTR